MLVEYYAMRLRLYVGTVTREPKPKRPLIAVPKTPCFAKGCALFSWPTSLCGELVKVTCYASVGFPVLCGSFPVPLIAD
jgi:hypothetical protein